MTSFLLLLSFLIHLILFITIYHLYEKTKRDQNEQAKEVENMLANFTERIRSENEKLEQKLHENKLKQRMTHEYTPPIPAETAHKVSNIKTTTYDKPAIKQPKMEDVVETSLEGQVLSLAKAGKSVDEIAKQLNRGKTEVELMIKLNQ